MFDIEIKDRLVAQGVGTFGTDIFISSRAVLPAGDGPFITLIETGGTDPAGTQNNTATERPSMQISSRAATKAAAKAKLALAYAALGGPNGLWNVVLSGVLYLKIKARSAPTDVGLDGTGDRVMFAFNIDVEKQPS